MLGIHLFSYSFQNQFSEMWGVGDKVAIPHFDENEFTVLLIVKLTILQNFVWIAEAA